MAKKLGKAFIFTAIAGAIAAGGMAIYNKYKASTDDFDDDFLDFDDEDEDDDELDFDDEDDSEDDNSNREYVSIPRENSEKKEDEYKVNVDVKISDSPLAEEDETDASTDNGSKVTESFFKDEIDILDDDTEV